MWLFSSLNRELCIVSSPAGARPGAVMTDPPQLNTQSPSPASHATGGVVAEMQDGNFLIRDTHFSVRRTNAGFFILKMQ